MSVSKINKKKESNVDQQRMMTATNVTASSCAKDDTPVQTATQNYYGQMANNEQITNETIHLVGGKTRTQPYQLKPAKTKKEGPWNRMRKVLRELIANAENRYLFQSTNLDKRLSTNRGLAIANKMRVIECTESNSLEKPNNGLPVYFVDDISDDTATGEICRPTIAVEKSYNELKMSELINSGALQIADNNDDPADRNMKIIMREHDGGTQTKLAAIKIGRRRRSLIRLAIWKHQHGKALQKAMNMQQTVARGKGREGMYEDKYVNMGVHYNRSKKNSVREYATERNVAAKDIVEAKSEVVRMVIALEKLTFPLLSSADRRVLEFVRNSLDVRDIMFDKNNGRYSQMALTRRYWSPWHTDDDVMLTLLCVYSPVLAERQDFDAVLCFFVLPTLGIAIPMRNTDVILFDSTVGHCVTNYQYADAFIFSLYTGSRTVFAKMCANEENEEAAKIGEDDDRRWQLVM